MAIKNYELKQNQKRERRLRRWNWLSRKKQKN